MAFRGAQSVSPGGQSFSPGGATFFTAVGRLFVPGARPGIPIEILEVSMLIECASAHSGFGVHRGARDFLQPINISPLLMPMSRPFSYTAFMPCPPPPALWRLVQGMWAPSGGFLPAPCLSLRRGLWEEHRTQQHPSPVSGKTNQKSHRAGLLSLGKHPLCLGVCAHHSVCLLQSSGALCQRLQGLGRHCSA